MYFKGEAVDDDNPDALEDTKESEQKTDASFQDIKNIAELRRWFFFFLYILLSDAFKIFTYKS